MTDRKRFRIDSDGDLEAVAIAETLELLAEIFGPYSFEVHGSSGSQQVVFQSRAARVLFFVRLHELHAEATDISLGDSAPRNVSLFGATEWLNAKYSEEGKSAGMSQAIQGLRHWLERPVKVRFWSGELWRYLEFEEEFKTLLAPQAHFSKHSLLKLGREVQRLQAMCERAGCSLSTIDAVAAKGEFAEHLDGMMEFHATHLAELHGKYFSALYRFVRGRYSQVPTNNLDEFPVPEGVTDDVFRYLYASAVVRFSRWREERIDDFIPETASSLRGEYPQHGGVSEE